MRRTRALGFTCHVHILPGEQAMNRFHGIVGILCLLGPAALAPAGPEFIHLGATDLGDGTYQHDYVLSNVGGTVPIYDLEYDGDFHHAWFSIEGPDDWNLHYNGLNWWFETEQAPCNVEQELFGYHIRAGTPTLLAGTATFTDQSHTVVASAPVMWPEPTGPTFTHIGVVDEGGGIYRHDYVLSNVGGAIPLYDLEYDGELYTGWFSIEGPDDWNLHYFGWGWRLDTEQAPCSIEQELFGYHIRAGTPSVLAGTVTFTDINHDLVAAGSTMWPESLGVIPAVSQWGLIVLMLVLLVAGTLILRPRAHFKFSMA